jgi:hypothetical protein
MGYASGGTFARLFLQGSTQQTIDGVSGNAGTILFGNFSGNNFISGNSAPLILGANLTVTGASGQITSNVAFDNQGTITADPTAMGLGQTSGTFTLSGTNWTNDGTIQAQNGGSLSLDGTSSATAPAWTNNSGHMISVSGTGSLTLHASGSPTPNANGTEWVNAGTINNNASTINLGGVFTQAALGTFTRTGGTINLQGTLNNVGTTLLLGSAATPGSWNLAGGGTINGGTIAAIGSNALVGTSNSTNLIGVTLDGTGVGNNISPLDMQTTGAWAFLSGGLTLKGAVLPLGNANGVTVGRLVLSGTTAQTIDGASGNPGTILLGGSVSNGIIGQNAPLTLGFNLTITGASGGIGSNVAWSNFGNIIGDPSAAPGAAAGTITLSVNPPLGSWTNNGTIEAKNGDTVTASSAPTNYSSGALTGGSWEVVSSTVGILASPTGATENGTTVTITTATPHGFTVGESVTIAGVSNSSYNGNFTITSVPTPTSFTYTRGSGLVASGGGTASNGNSALRLTGNITTNAAVILLDGAGSNIFNGSGTTNALATLTNNNNNLTLQNGASLTLNSATSLTNSGTVAILSGAGLTIGSGGSYTQSASDSFGYTEVGAAATLVVSGGGGININGGLLAGSGTVSGGLLTIGTGAFLMAGDFAPGTLSTADVTFQSGSEFLTILNSDSSFGVLSSGGTVTIPNPGVTLGLSVNYTTSPGHILTIITATSVSATDPPFSALTVNGASSPFTQHSNANSVFLQDPPAHKGPGKPKQAAAVVASQPAAAASIGSTAPDGEVAPLDASTLARSLLAAAQQPGGSPSHVNATLAALLNEGPGSLQANGATLPGSGYMHLLAVVLRELGTAGPLAAVSLEEQIAAALAAVPRGQPALEDIAAAFGF